MECIELPDDLRSFIQCHLTGNMRSIVPLGSGLDNTAWLVNDELIVRQPKDPDPASRADAIRREVELLAIVGHHSPLPVPEIVFSDAEHGVLAYRLLPGRAAVDLPDAHLSLDIEPLGRFLAAIHAIPVPEVEFLVPRDDDPLADWLDEAIGAYAGIASSLPASSRPRVEAFLAAPPPPVPDKLVFCHNDLGAEHVLVDLSTMRITGIIDWTDAAITDPMRDLALILRDFGSDALDRVLAVYGIDITPGDLERLLFHARCKLLEDIAFGVESNSARYLDAGLAHLEWTFS